MHTCQSSACAENTGSQMAIACKEAGYQGIIVTDHFWGGNTAIDRKLPWRDWAEQFCQGFFDAEKQGKQIDLDVFFGWESGYNGTEFLIYGLSPAWLIEHEEIRDATIQEQFEIVHKYDGLVVHAHPYREEPYIKEIRLFPEYVDAVETINATHSNHLSTSHNNPQYNVLALEYAEKYKFPQTAGSDIHSTRLFMGGMYFQERLTSIRDYINTIKNIETNNSYILTDGEKIY